MNAIPTKPFLIRHAYPAEYALLGRMTADVYAKLDGMPGRVEQPGYYAKLLDVAQRARVPTCEILVAVSPDNALLGGVTFVGDMTYYGSGGTAGTLKASSGLRFLAVKPEARQQGVGRALTHECIQRAICRRSTRIVLHTTRAMQIAWILYESMGFIRREDLDFQQGHLTVYGFSLGLRIRS